MKVLRPRHFSRTDFRKERRPKDTRRVTDFPIPQALHFATLSAPIMILLPLRVCQVQSGRVCTCKLDARKPHNAWFIRCDVLNITFLKQLAGNHATMLRAKHVPPPAMLPNFAERLDVGNCALLALPR